MSSPAQSFASVMKVPSNSCLFCRAAFCSFCLGSFGASSGSFRQQTNAQARHSSTTSSPAMNVKIDDSRKHHHFLTLRQSSSMIAAVVASSSDEAIPRGREASSQACSRHARAMRALARQPARYCRGRPAPRGRCRPIDPRLRTNAPTTTDPRSTTSPPISPDLLLFSSLRCSATPPTFPAAPPVTPAY